MFDFKDDGEILYDSDDVENLRRRMNQKRELLVRQQTLAEVDPARARDEAIINEVMEKAKKYGASVDEVVDRTSNVADKVSSGGAFDLLPIKTPNNNIDNDLDAEIQRHLNGDGDSEPDFCCSSPPKNTNKIIKDLHLLKSYHKMQAKMLGAYIEKMEKRLR